MKKYLLKNSFYLALITLIFLSFYYVIRFSTLALSDLNFWDRSFGIILFLGETHILLHATGYILGIIRLKGYRLEFRQAHLIKGKEPQVAVVVAAKNEPNEVLEKTLTAFQTINYSNKNVYLLDGSDKKIYRHEAKDLGKFFKTEIFRQDKVRGAKAGMVNDFLAQMQEKYIAIFDADQNPTPGFLEKTISILEANPKTSFVQTPQFYSNIDVSHIAKGAEMQQAIFFENMCEAKEVAHAMFCCGTNVVFRREALLSVGGFEEESITEDFATSLKLHLAGWKSHYYNHILAFGMAPENLPAYFKQQNRWAVGTIGVFRQIIKNFFTHARKLKLVQWWEYFLSGTHYFIGWAFFFLMICPIVYLIFGVPSYFMNPYVYLLLYVPYFVFSLTVFFTTMFKRKYHLLGVYYGIILATLSFPVLMKSALYGIVGKKVKFEITSKGKNQNMPLLALWPWLVMIIVNIFAVTFGLFKIFNLNAGESNLFYALAINIFWCCYHLFILSFIFYFNKKPRFVKNIDIGHKEIK